MNLGNFILRPWRTQIALFSVVRVVDSVFSNVMVLVTLSAGLVNEIDRSLGHQAGLDRDLSIPCQCNLPSALPDPFSLVMLSLSMDSFAYFIPGLTISCQLLI